ncbi:MAG: hypothetical protein ACKV0T_10920 [Planctomycetales bacterium]
MHPRRIIDAAAAPIPVGRGGSALWKCLAVAVCLSCASRGLLAEGDSSELKSGLQVGEKVPTFYVRAITGPLKNKSVCYVCRNGNRPVVMLLVREVTPELTRLLKEVDQMIDSHRAAGLRGFGVFLARENQNLLPTVQTLAFNERLGLPLTISAAPADGPAGQKVHPDAEVTVILYRELSVTANFAFRQGELTNEKLSQVLEAVAALAEED